jgi:Domain of unknown function (DUF4386)
MKSAPELNHTTNGNRGSAWRGLCTAGGAAALVAALGFRRNLGSEYMLLRSLGVFQTGPAAEPTSAAGWLALFQSSPLVAFTLFSAFDLLNYALVALIYLGLYAALRQVNRGAMVIAVAFGLVGVGVYFASNQAFAMQVLSARYAAASEIERTMLLAAAEALLAIHNPGAVFPGAGVTLGLFLVTATGLIIAVVMLGSDIFGKATAVFGILAHCFMLGYFVTWSFGPAVRAIPPSLSGLFLLVWYILVGIKLLRLGSKGGGVHG